MDDLGDEPRPHRRVGAVRGVLFDLDGVLADTERLQWQAYREVLREFGVDVDVEEYRVHWIASGTGPEYACRTYALPLTPEELRARKAPRYRALVARGVQARPGARAALERLRGRLRLAVATNSARAEVALILAQLGMAPLLDAVVAREDYVRAKPAPDAYLAAAAALGLAPTECVVVEDTARGVRAALAAGMRVVAIPHELTHDNDFTGCARRLDDFAELTVELLGALV
jgi:HAD superfamily hydrolase (TIGR01509 family)